MRERDRLAIKAHREEIEAIERAEQEERERPIREAEAQLKRNHMALINVYRERLTGRVPDPDVFIDPAVSNVHMTEKDAKEFNRQNAIAFQARHPEIYPCRELRDLLATYFDRNGLTIISSAMLENVIGRLDEAGLLPQRPERPEMPETPEPSIESAQRETEQTPHTETQTGIDPLTGSPKEYTAREIGRMSGDEYRRAFPIASTMKDLFGAMSIEGEYQ